MQSANQLVAARKPRELPESVLNYEATDSGSSQSSSCGEVTAEVLGKIIEVLDSITPKPSQESDIFSSQDSFSYSQSDLEKLISPKDLAEFLVEILPVELLSFTCNTLAKTTDHTISKDVEKNIDLVFDVINCMYKNPDLIRELVGAAIKRLCEPGPIDPTPPLPAQAPEPPPQAPEPQPQALTPLIQAPLQAHPRSDAKPPLPPRIKRPVLEASPDRVLTCTEDVHDVRDSLSRLAKRACLPTGDSALSPAP